MSDQKEYNSFQFIFNSTNLVANNPYNNVFTYNFSNANITFGDTAQCCINSISIPYSWNNISASFYNNNVLTLIWPNASTTTNFTWTIPDGFYTIQTLNQAFLNFQETNGLYLIDNNGNFRFYSTISTNPTYYAIELDEYPLPTSLPASWSYPANFYSSLPTTGYTPQIIIPATNATGTNISNILGLPAGTYPAVQTTSQNSQLSTFTPQVSQVNNLVFLVNLCNNIYSVPNNLIYSCPINAQFGSLITASPYAQWVPCVKGTFSNITITIVDQNLNPVGLKDDAIDILLNVRTLNKGLHD